MRTALVLLVSLCAACVGSIGPRAAQQPFALGAEGAHIRVLLTRSSGDLGAGELLAVTDSGLWVIADSHISWAAFSVIVHAQFDNTAGDDIQGPEKPSGDVLERLRLESRFPQGIAPDLLKKLLRTYGDTILRTLSFLDSARRATARYRDVSQALADGYRPFGPGTPAMGQHWVNIGLLIGGKVDPTAPAILEYASVDGDSMPMLVGVAYAMPLGAADEPPDDPVPASWWHSHHGTLDAEALSGSHAGMDMGEGDRVAVLHAWLWLPNPAGDFEAENWLLPLASWVRGFRAA